MRPYLSLGYVVGHCVLTQSLGVQRAGSWLEFLPLALCDPPLPQKKPCLLSLYHSAIFYEVKIVTPPLPTSLMHQTQALLRAPQSLI